MALETALLVVSFVLPATAFLVGCRLVFTTTKSWWKSLLAGLVSVVLPALLIPLYQVRCLGQTQWTRWTYRLGFIALVIAAVWAIEESQLLITSEISRNVFFGLVCALSTDAISFEGNTILTSGETPFELAGWWKGALVLGAYGSILGALYLRYAFSAAIAFGWIGVVVGGLLEANHTAGCIDAEGQGRLDEFFAASQTVSYTLPILLVPWAALLVLIWLKPDPTWVEPRVSLEAPQTS